MIDSLLKIVAPHRCYGCLERGNILCNGCYDDIILEDFGRCVWCLRPTGEMNQCRDCGVRLGIAGTWVVGERSDVLKRVVGNYKYQSEREAGGILARLLSDKIALLPRETVVTTIPTVSQHVRQRGFDHAIQLAGAFARERDLMFTPLLKRRHMRPQHDLKLAARRTAAEEAFGLQDRPVPKTVLLIDDILTTGATLEVCVRLLYEAGAKQVFVGVVARQPLDETPSPLVK